MSRNTKKPLISIIVPTFNESGNIVRLLMSIQKQSYKKIESLVVDDGSTDNTAELASKYASRVFVRKHSERSVQRNFGASKATGKYLIFLDADMELTPKVVDDCINRISDSDHKALIIPEKTMGDNFMSQVRRFEREMYEGDPSIEVARFFDKKVFNDLGGYDENLTGAEDYDLPHRLSKKHSIGRSTEYVLHHEQSLSFRKQLSKKYYYASRSVVYADKHPELVATQGNMLFRKAYIRNWKKFLAHPLLGSTFIVVRVFETSAAVLGYIQAAGILKFIKKILGMFKS